MDRAAYGPLIIDTLEHLAARGIDPTDAVYARLFAESPELEPLFILGPGAKGHMLGMERRLQERLVAGRWLGHRGPSKGARFIEPHGPLLAPPLSRALRDFPWAPSAPRLRPSVGGVLRRRRFPECQLPRGPLA